MTKPSNIFHGISPTDHCADSSCGATTGQEHQPHCRYFKADEPKPIQQQLPFVQTGDGHPMPEDDDDPKDPPQWFKDAYTDVHKRTEGFTKPPKPGNPNVNPFTGESHPPMETLSADEFTTKWGSKPKPPQEDNKRDERDPAQILFDGWKIQQLANMEDNKRFECGQCGSTDIETKGTDAQPFWCKACGASHIRPTEDNPPPPSPKMALFHCPNCKVRNHVPYGEPEIHCPECDQLLTLAWATDDVPVNKTHPMSTPTGGNQQQARTPTGTRVNPDVHMGMGMDYTTDTTPPLTPDDEEAIDALADALVDAFFSKLRSMR